VRWYVAGLVVLGVNCAGRSEPVGANPPPADLDLLYEAATTACEAVSDVLPADTLGRAELSRQGQEKGAWLVDEALCRILLGRGWRVVEPRDVRFPPDSAGGHDTIGLEYRIVKMDIRYGPLRRGLWKAGLVERRAEVELAFRLKSESEGRLLWVGRGRGQAVGVVQKKVLPLVAHPELSPPEDQWPGGRSWANEIAVTAGLLGLLLAVFYAGTV
jgi:hypothetical protein